MNMKDVSGKNGLLEKKIQAHFFEFSKQNFRKIPFLGPLQIYLKKPSHRHFYRKFSNFFFRIIIFRKTSKFFQI